MINTQYLTAELESCFTQIQNVQMKGIPILNQAMGVEAVGFHEWQGHCVGIMVTPWLMSLMLFPGSSDEWDDLAVGAKESHEFPAGSYEFTVNEFDGVGRCQTYPIHSPMNQFDTHEDALAVARTFIEVLMVEAGAPDDEDEVRFSRFLDGDEMAQIQLDEQVQEEVDCQCPSLKESADRVISRRDLLRGEFQG